MFFLISFDIFFSFFVFELVLKCPNINVWLQPFSKIREDALQFHRLQLSSSSRRKKFLSKFRTPKSQNFKENCSESKTPTYYPVLASTFLKHLWLRGAGLQHQKCDSKRKWEKKSHLILFTNTHTHTHKWAPCAFCNACLSSYFTPIIFLVKIKGREWWYHIFRFTTVPKETRFNDVLCHEDVKKSLPKPASTWTTIKSIKSETCQ